MPLGEACMRLREDSRSSFTQAEALGRDDRLMKGESVGMTH